MKQQIDSHLIVSLFTTNTKLREQNININILIVMV